MKMATPAQVEACRTLFRKAKIYYRTLTDDAKLRDEVLKRTNIDLDELEAYEVDEIFEMLEPEVDKRWKFPANQAAAIGAKAAAAAREEKHLRTRQHAETLCKIGDRVRMVQMDPNDPDPQTPGVEGTVLYIDDVGTIYPRWDNGRSVGLIPGVDQFEVIS